MATAPLLPTPMLEGWSVRLSVSEDTVPVHIIVVQQKGHFWDQPFCPLWRKLSFFGSLGQRTFGDPGKCPLLRAVLYSEYPLSEVPPVVHIYVVRLARLHKQLTGVGRVAAIFSSSNSELSQEMWPHAVARAKMFSGNRAVLEFCGYR